MTTTTYLWSQGMVDSIAKKVAEEDMKSQHIDHVEEERLADEARERERDRRQMEMFNDPYENWSGHR